MLLRRAALIVKGHHPLGGPAEIGDDEPDTGKQLAGVPLHLGHDAAGFVPASSLIAKASVIAPHMVRRTANGAGQRMGDNFLENLVLWYRDRVQEAPGFEVFVKLRHGERGIPSEVAAQVPNLVANDNRLQHASPVIGAVDVAGTEETPFQIAELVEQA